MKKERILLLDANALIHRAYHALPPLTSSDGAPVGALYGLCLTLMNVLKTFKPTHIVAAFDRPEKTFRHEEFKEYKGTRKKAEPELIEQIIRAREVFMAFGVPVIELAGYEADDIIGTLSVKATKEKIEAIIVTGDQDSMQLVDENVKVFMLKRGIKDTVTMGVSDVIEKYGLTPEQIVDYKALRGDPSDNIPGVPGIGEKTATQLLQKYETLEGVYSHLEELPEKLRAKLNEGKEKGQMSKRLAQIHLSVPLKENIVDLLWQNYSREQAVELLRNLGFSSLLTKIPEADTETIKETKKSQGSLLGTVKDPRASRRTSGYELVTTEKRAREVVVLLKKSKEFVVDTETDSLEARTAPLCGISLAIEEGKAWYVTKELVPFFKDVLEDEKIGKMGHNLKYDVEVLLFAGIKVSPIAFDSMLASYCLSANTRNHGLDNLAFTLLGHEMIPIEALIGRNGRPARRASPRWAGPNQKVMSEIDLADVAEYSCEDADYTLRLINLLRSRLKEVEGPKRVFEEIEMPLVPVLVEMETAGIKIDVKILKELSTKLGRRVKILEKQICELAGEDFNVNSPAQLQDILFKKLQLPTVGIGRIQSGLSTAADELEKLVDKHPIIAKIQEYRELAKLKNTYLDTLPKLLDKETGRLHTSYNQIGTTTGRLSSSDPNLQNIPIRTEIGAEIRKAFVAERGKLLVAADYSQVELRIAAHVARDKVMQQVFKDGKDIHTETASFALRIPKEQITRKQRSQAKELNFGVLYGMGASSFARASGVSLGEAQAFIAEYMRTYRGIAEYMQEAKALASSQGFVETIYGRRSYLPDINSGNSMIRSAAERASINHPIQGSEGDIIKRAMVAVQEKIDEGQGVFNGSKMLLQVHDELIFEVPKENAEKFAKEIKPLLENLEKLAVPLTVDLKIGKNWGEMA
ncbi:MAG: DNA polymerase I [bacterium]|nr:DNA polymerase I [bacterium]